MKKYVLLTVTILALAVAGQASAQTAAPAAPAPGAAMSAAPGGNELPFPQRKAQVLENLQKRIACVQASQNRQQMRACFPERQGGAGGAPGGAPQH